MAHMIEGDNMFSVKIEPWHHRGVVLDNPPTSEEAIKAAGMSWAVEKRKLFWEVPPKADGPDVYVKSEIPNKVALVRSTDEKLLSVVSNSYRPLQNAEAFAWFDPIVKAGQATYETAGVLCGGTRVWILARLNKEIVVDGDQYKQYILLTNGHDGCTGISIAPVHTRVVCANTMRLAMSEGNCQWFAHIGDLGSKLEKAKAVYELAESTLEEHERFLNRLAGMPVSAAEVDRLLDSILRIPDVPDEQTLGPDGIVTPSGSRQQLAAKDKILELAENADDGASRRFKGTAYGILNAVTEFVDHYSGRRSQDVGNYQLFGEGHKMKARAYAELDTLVG